jgi:hypothetical protein
MNEMTARFDRVLRLKRSVDEPAQLLMYCTDPECAVPVTELDVMWFGAGFGWDWRNRRGQQVLIHYDEKGFLRIRALVTNRDFDEWCRR